MSEDMNVTETQTVEGPIHVSFKTVKNTMPAARYKMKVTGFTPVVSSKGNPGIRVQLKPNKDLYPEYEKRTVNDSFWFTPEAMNLYLSFLFACDINQEMLREEPVEPAQFDAEGNRVTSCVYSIDDQIKSILLTDVYADITEESYDGVAADGVTPERKWVNRVATRGYSKV